MPVSPDFSSVSAADSAYYSDNGGDENGDDNENGGTPDPTTGTWGKPYDVETWSGGWTLVAQDTEDGERTRYFVLRGDGDTVEAINGSGVVETASADAPMADLPMFSTKADARAAHKKWVDAQDGPVSPPTDEGWGEWSRIRELTSGWYLFGRTSTDGQRVQFVVSGEAASGTVYLNASGQVQVEPHLFSSFADVQSALAAYQQAVENGSIAEDDQPTGNAPTTDTIRESVTQTSSQSSTSVEKLAGKKVLLAAVGSLGLVALAKGGKLQ